MIALLASFAWAECNEQWPEEDFRDLLVDATDSIDMDDIIGHGRVYKALREKMPCINVVLPKEPWADFLVGLAIVDYALGRPWKSTVATAVRIHPGVDRSYGPPDLQSYRAPALPALGKDLDDGALYFVDGQPVTQAPDLRGLHIVQRLEGKELETRVLEGTPFPEDWVPLPDVVMTRRLLPSVDETVAPQQKTPVSGALAVVGGVGTSQQRGTAPGPTLPDRQAAGGVVGGTLYGAVGYPFGVFVDTSVAPQLGERMNTDAYGGLNMDFGPAQIWVGFGGSSVHVVQNGEELGLFTLQPHVAVRTLQAMNGPFTFDGMLNGGLLGGSWHTGGRLGVNRIAKDAVVGWTGGLDFAVAGATFEQARAEGVNAAPRSTNALRYSVGLRFGLAFAAGGRE